MFIVSPKWVYLSNKKIESNKSLLIEGSIIVDGDLVELEIENMGTLKNIVRLIDEP